MWEGGAGRQGHISRQVWVIATSSRDVAQAVQDQRLRAELYHRVCGIPLVVPPLRERSGDIAPLVHHMLTSLAEREEQSDTAFTPAALRILQEYGWPGNVRELRHVIERSLLLARGPRIGVEALPPFLQSWQSRPSPALQFPQTTLPTAVAEVEREMIAAALQRTAGNQTHAARLLGMSRRVLGYKLRQDSLGNSRKK